MSRRFYSGSRDFLHTVLTYASPSTSCPCALRAITSCQPMTHPSSLSTCLDSTSVAVSSVHASAGTEARQIKMMAWNPGTVFYAS